jgi:hypothetical protein
MVRACFANLARQAQFGEFIRHSKRTAGVRLDAAQTVPDGVRVNMELGCGIVGRALVGTPRREGVEEDIFFFFFFAAQVIELAEDSRATVVAARLSRRVSMRRSPGLLKSLIGQNRTVVHFRGGAQTELRCGVGLLTQLNS